MCRFYVNKISASHQATRQTNMGGREAAQDSKPSDSSRQFRIVTSSFVTAYVPMLTTNDVSTNEKLYHLTLG
jgi:hypothetical protein